MALSLVSKAPQDLYSLPHSIESEKALLGGFLMTPGQFDAVSSSIGLHPDDFYYEPHKLIYSAMSSMNDEEKRVFDAISVIGKLKGLNQLNVNDAYIIQLLDYASLSVNLEYHAKIIKHKKHLRRIIDACHGTIQKASRAEDSKPLIEELEKLFLEIGRSEDSKNGLKNAKEVLLPTLEILEQRIAAGGKLTGVSSGFTALDHYTGGWQKSDLVILAARPGMGKTALALNWALNALRYDQEAIVAVFTLEMSKEQLMERLLSSMGRIDSVKMRKGDLGDEDQDRLMHGAKEIHKFGHRLVIDETPGLSLAQLRSRCRRYKKEHQLHLIIIDYLQLMSASPTAQKQGREREIGEISMGLKGLAKELGVPIIAAAQLNRGPDSRPDKRPKISDLRESGSMEQDADMILFVYRDEYYNPNSEHAGKAEVIIAKNRHGETGSLHLAWLPNFVSFHNLVT